jgi:YtkA-like
MLVVTACRRSSGREPQISVHSQITPQPARVGPATITIQMLDEGGKPVTRSTIGVEADMSHPGMAPVFGEAEETAPGSYRAHIGFNMGGDWVVLLHIKLPDGGKIERQVDVRGVQSN